MTNDVINKDAKVTWLHTRNEVNNSPANANKEHVFQDMLDDFYCKIDELQVMADNMLEYFPVGSVTIEELKDVRHLNWTVLGVADSLLAHTDDLNAKYGRENVKSYAKYKKVTFQE